MVIVYIIKNRPDIIIIYRVYFLIISKYDSLKLIYLNSISHLDGSRVEIYMSKYIACSGKSGLSFELALAPTEEYQNGPKETQVRGDHCAFA